MQHAVSPGHFRPHLLFILLWLLACLPAQGQIDAEDFIRTGVDNTHKLLRAYGAPLTTGFSTSLNGGWLTGGQALKPGHFEVLFAGTATFVPRKDQTFDVTRIGLDAQVQPANQDRKLAPTFFGEDRQGLPLEVYGTRPDNGERVRVAAFNSAPGVGFQVAPFPMAQLNVGLVQQTELMLRFMPEVTFSDNRVKQWGLGLKHELSQWIPGFSQLPFGLTATLAYTAFRFSDGLSLEPEKGVANPSPGDYSSQRIRFDTQAYHASLVFSRTFFDKLNIYGGASYSKGQTETGLAGTYPVTVIRQQAPYTKEIANLTDPVRLDLAQSQPGLTGGLRVRKGLFSFHLAGTWSRYSSLSAGMGLGWQ